MPVRSPMVPLIILSTTSLYRTDDMARCIYRLRLDVTRPLEYSRFVILQIGADTYGYTRERQMAVGNETGLIRQWSTAVGRQLLSHDAHAPGGANTVGLVA